MDVLKAIEGRRSIRVFKRDEVSPEIVHKLLDAATCAPSAGNIQPWEFVIIRDAKVKQKLASAALDQTFIEEAPVVIVVCADEAQSSLGYGSRGVTLYCLQDTAAAIQNILLAAHALGLSTCWIGAFQEELVKRALNTPQNIRPVAIIPIGHAAERPRAPPRKSLKEIIHHETFKNYFE